MKKKIIILGSGGHANSCIEILNNLNQDIYGYIDKNKNNNFNYRYLGDDKEIQTFDSNKYSFIIGFANYKNLSKR